MGFPDLLIPGEAGNQYFKGAETDGIGREVCPDGTEGIFHA